MKEEMQKERLQNQRIEAVGSFRRLADGWLQEYADIQTQERLEYIAPDEVPTGDRSSAPCAYCRGTGWYVLDVPINHPDFGKLQRCACNPVQATIPLALGRYQEKTFDSYLPNTGKQEKIKTFCAAYAQSLNGWLILHGKGGSYTGTGKSHLAAAIANVASASGISVEYATVPDLLGHLLSNWEQTEERVTKLMRVGLLILDDAGQEVVRGGGIDQFGEKFFRVLNYRDMENLPVVITSNYTLDELAAKPQYIPAIISRIKGQTHGRRIFMDGSDYRAKDK